jgi:hypothetical protein
VTEKRTLEVATVVNDQASAGFKKMEAAAVSAGKAIAAGFTGASASVLRFTEHFLALAAEHAFEKGLELGIRAFEEFGRAVLDAVHDVTQLGRVSDTFGITVESLSELRHGAERVGVGVEELATSFKHFEQAQADASKGGKSQLQAFAQLGISTREFAGDQLDAVDVLARVADGLEGIGSTAQRTRILIELFGRQGAQLAPLLKQGATGVRELADEARAAGVAFSREQVQRVQDLTGAWIALQQSFKSIVERIVVDLSPAFTGLFKEVAKAIQENLPQIRAAFFDFALIFVQLVKQVADLVQPIVSSLRTVTNAFTDFFLRLRVIGAEAQLFNAQVIQGSAQALSDAQVKVGGARAALNNFEREQDTSAGVGQRFTDAIDRSFEALMDSIKAAREAAAAPLPTPEPKKRAKAAVEGVEDVDHGVDNLTAGIVDASQKWRDFNQTVYESGGKLVDGVLGGLDDAVASIVAHTKSAKQAFQDFGKSTLTLLAQLITRLITVRILSAIFGAGNISLPGIGVQRAQGGVDPVNVLGTMPLRKFAQGGIAQGPTLALLGEGKEAGEAFVPLPDGRRIPVAWNGGGPGGDVHVTINAVDAKSVQELLARNRGLLRSWAAEDLDERWAVRQVAQRT